MFHCATYSGSFGVAAKGGQQRHVLQQHLTQRRLVVLEQQVAQTVRVLHQRVLDHVEAIAAQVLGHLGPLDQLELRRHVGQLLLRVARRAGRPDHEHVGQRAEQAVAVLAPCQSVDRFEEV
jgi:hypothetical protein